jgi:hypothetical protein
MPILDVAIANSAIDIIIATGVGFSPFADRGHSQVQVHAEGAHRLATDAWLGRAGACKTRDSHHTSTPPPQRSSCVPILSHALSRLTLTVYKYNARRPVGTGSICRSPRVSGRHVTGRSVRMNTAYSAWT